MGKKRGSQKSNNKSSDAAVAAAVASEDHTPPPMHQQEEEEGERRLVVEGGLLPQADDPHLGGEEEMGNEPPEYDVQEDDDNENVAPSPLPSPTPLSALLSPDETDENIIAAEPDTPSNNSCTSSRSRGSSSKRMGMTMPSLDLNLSNISASKLFSGLTSSVGGDTPRDTPRDAARGFVSAARSSSSSSKIGTTDSRLLRTMMSDTSSHITAVSNAVCLGARSLFRGMKHDENLRRAAKSVMSKESSAETLAYSMKKLEMAHDVKVTRRQFGEIKTRLEGVRKSEDLLHDASKKLFSVWHIVEGK